MVCLTPVGSSDTASYAAYGRIAAQGTVPEILQNEDPLVRQFITGSATGPLEIRSSEGDYYNDLLNI